MNSALQLGRTFLIVLLSLSLIVPGFGSGLGVPQVAAADSQAATGGQIYVFGSNGSGQLGLGPDVTGRVNVLTPIAGFTNVVSVAMGYEHTVLLTSDGKLYSFGRGEFGALGHGLDQANQLSPKEIEIFKEGTTELTAPNLPQIKAVYAHGNSSGATAYSMFLSEDGALYSTGKSNYFVLGHGNTSQVTVPTRIDTFMDGSTPLTGNALPRVAKVAAGEHHALILTEEGDVYAVGDGSAGALGTGVKDNYNRPTKIQALAHLTIKDIAAGSSFSIVVTEKGEVYTFGSGGFGNLGHGAQFDQELLPKKIESFVIKTSDTDRVLTGEDLPVVRRAFAKTGGAFFLTEEGDLFSNGSNSYLRMGYEGNAETRPTRINTYKVGSAILPERPKIAQVAVSNGHSMVVDENGVLYTISNTATFTGAGVAYTAYTAIPAFSTMTVIAMESNGNHSAVIAVPKPEPATPPAAQPTDLALAREGAGVSVSFTISDAERYLVVRGNGASPQFVPTNGRDYTPGAQGADTVVAVLAAAGGDQQGRLTVLDEGAVAGQTYYYRVYALNGEALSTSYLRDAPLAAAIAVHTGTKGVQSVLEAGTSVASSHFPDAGVDVIFPQGLTQPTTLNVSRVTNEPTNFMVMPNVRRVSNLHFNVEANPSETIPATPYTLVLDFSSLGLTENQWKSFKIFKRSSPTDPWQDVVHDLGAKIDDRKTDGIWGKFTVSGLTSFSQFAGGIVVRPEDPEDPEVDPEDVVFTPQVHTVTNNANTGEGSLRAMLAVAEDGDIIEFDTEMESLVIRLGDYQEEDETKSGTLTFDKNVTLRGSGVRLDGDGAVRVVEIAEGISVRMENLFIQNGKDENNIVGGVLNEGTLTLVNVVVSGNRATGVSGGSGGAGGSGGIGGVGGILQEAPDAKLVLINTTVSGNAGADSADGVGGVAVYASNVEGTLIQGQVEFYNSIFYGNAGEFDDVYIDDTLHVSRNSLYGFSDFNFTIESGSELEGGNLFGADPQFVGTGLHPYLIYGNSPAVDAGSDAFLDASINTDIRGGSFGRKLSQADASPGTVDIGAYEYKDGVDPYEPPSSDATVTTREQHYTVNEGEPPTISSNATLLTSQTTVQELQGHLNRHPQAEWIVVSADVEITDAAGFDAATGKAADAKLAVGDQLVVKSGDGTIRVYNLLVEVYWRVEFEPNGGSAEEAQVVKAGTSVTLPDPAPERTGHTFTGWFIDAQLTNLYGFDEDVSADLALYAGWTANTYTVTFDAGEGTVSPDTQIKQYGATYGKGADGEEAELLPVPMRPGYTFTGWYEGEGGTGNRVTDASEVVALDNHTLYAGWTVNTYTVTFDAGDDAAVSPTTQVKQYGATYGKGADGETGELLPTPTRPGYTFTGWYAEAGESGTLVVDTTEVTAVADHTLYAGWIANTYTVTFDAAEGTVDTAEQVKQFDSNYGKDANGEADEPLPVPTRPGYTFTGWYYDNGEALVRVQNDTPVTIAEDHTLVAQWRVIPPVVVLPPQQPQESGVVVLVNGRAEQAGTATTREEDNGRTVTTVTVNEAILLQQLEAEGTGTVIAIPVSGNAQVAVGELNGRMVKSMEQQQAVVEIRTDSATYVLPARQLNIDAISASIGAEVELQDILIRIVIAAAPQETAGAAEQAAAAGGFTLVTAPLDFTVYAAYGDRQVEVTRFNAYVERAVALPEGVDPSAITTGVVLEADGTVRHVPTKVVEQEGRYYAWINSLTNSTYTVIWHPVTFADMAGHWAEATVNNMGSRMIVSGNGEGLFSPNRFITRAEFAAILVRGLGLPAARSDGASRFTDVSGADWYSGVVQTAGAYGLINGYADGSFRPNERITREQAMLIVSKAMALTGLRGAGEEELSATAGEQAAQAQEMAAGEQAAQAQAVVAEVLRLFTDAEQVSPWAAQGVADTASAGIVSGRSNGTLAPKALLTRAEVSVMIERLLQQSGLI